MRALVYLIALVILGGIAREQIDWTPIVVPYRLARLYSELPDTVLTMPVEGVAAKAVADTWNAPRSGERRHQGQDIFARRGTPVLAAADGIVTRLGGGALGGNAVFVMGRGARTYYYAHLDSYADGLETGQLVEQGTILGYVGNTGNAANTPSHLHFGIYAPNGAINPLPLLHNTAAKTHRVSRA